jgi:hypothetical protein
MDQIHSSHAEGLYTEADERAGYVVHRYNLWFVGLGFHVGYRSLVVKVRPADGAVLAAKVQVE